MDWSDMIFQNWEGIVRTLIVGALAYAGLVIFIRISGKRTLAKLNAFDLVVTVALGSTLSSVLLQESVALLEGMTAFAVLIALQFAVSWFSVRSQGFAKLVRSEPKLLARDGAFCSAALKTARVTEDEALSAVRAAGAADIAQTDYVILESDGSISVGLSG